MVSASGRKESWECLPPCVLWRPPEATHPQFSLCLPSSKHSTHHCQGHDMYGHWEIFQNVNSDCSWIVILCVSFGCVWGGVGFPLPCSIFLKFFTLIMCYFNAFKNLSKMCFLKCTSQLEVLTPQGLQTFSTKPAPQAAAPHPSRSCLPGVSAGCWDQCLGAACQVHSCDPLQLELL